MGNEKLAKSISRVDGRLKVTGGAKYFAEFEAPNMAFAVMATSTIARGIITEINTKAAEKAPGVLAVFTHLNMPKIPGWEKAPSDKKEGQKSAGGQTYKMLGSNQILFSGQPIALVVADTLERANYAASTITTKYNKQKPQTDLDKNLSKAATPGWGGDYKRGETGAYKTAAVTLDERYVMPMEVHSPMELHGVLAVWNSAEKVTVYAKTQGVQSTQEAVANAFKLEQKNVQVYSEFVGGGFGMALITWPQEIVTIAAAKKLGRPVKLVMSRDQMFTMVGYRPYTAQQFFMGATKDGKLVGMEHHANGVTASYEDFTEGVTNMTKFMYACPNVTTKYRIVPLDIGVPIWMRGPGEATGAFALESAMDEMAHKLQLDPIQFRLINFAETDPEKNLPFSSNYVKEAYELGSKKIGWDKRKAEPRSTEEDGWLIGYGMSNGTFGAYRDGSTCKGKLNADGTLVLQSATSDIGPGTGTAMVQIAHDVLGISIDKIKFELGNSSYPKTGSQGGSATVASVGSAVHDVCSAIKTQLAENLISNESYGFKDAKPTALLFKDNAISKPDGDNKIDITEALTKLNLPAIEITKESKLGKEQEKYSMYSFSIHFVVVKVHPTTGVVRIKKIVSVADSGKIVSPKTAASQMIGGATGGIGMALMEEAIFDHRYGRLTNNNFADYHVPVSADVPHIETIFIDKPDPIINPMGAKGMGEIALIGFAAAVANAVFNATGKRIRELPITPDKLIQSFKNS